MSGLRAEINRRIASLDGILPAESQFGHGTAYWANGKEIAHFEGDDVIEIRLTRAVIRANRPMLTANEHVELRKHGGDWITVRFTDRADVDLVLDLLVQAELAHRPPPGVPAKPPPTGAALARRQRFH